MSADRAAIIDLQATAATQVLYRCIKEMLAQGIDRQSLRTSLCAIADAMPGEISGPDEVAFVAVCDVLDCFEGHCAAKDRL